LAVGNLPLLRLKRGERGEEGGEEGSPKPDGIPQSFLRKVGGSNLHNCVEEGENPSRGEGRVEKEEKANSKKRNRKLIRATPERAKKKKSAPVCWWRAKVCRKAALAGAILRRASDSRGSRPRKDIPFTKIFTFSEVGEPCGRGKKGGGGVEFN